MRNMKKLIYAILGSFLSALGFTGCDGTSEEEPQTLEYGGIITNFMADIKVTDESGTPIKGIRAIDITNYGEDVYQAFRDTLYSDSKGIVHDEKSIPKPIDRYVLAFKDVDGNLNGGTFAPDTVEFDVKGNGDISAWAAYKVTATQILKK